MNLFSSGYTKLKSGVRRKLSYRLWLDAVCRNATPPGNEGAGTHSKIGSIIHSSRFLRDVHLERRVCEEWAAVSGVVEEMRYNVRISLIFLLIELAKFLSR